MNRPDESGVDFVCACGWPRVDHIPVAVSSALVAGVIIPERQWALLCPASIYRKPSAKSLHLKAEA